MILIFIIFSAIGLLLALVSAIKIIGIAILCIVIFTLVAVGYIGIFVAGISAVGFFEWWGVDNGGWAFLAGGFIGLLTIIGILVAIADEIKDRTQFFLQVFRCKSVCDKKINKSHD